MNLRKQLYFTLFGLRGQPVGAYYKRFLQETQEGIPADTTKKLLVELLAHCKQSVPYYSRIMNAKKESFEEDPEEYLRNFPILTKDIVRNHFEELKSSDLANRKWYFNTSGGSTGTPVRLIQDWDYAAKMGALKLLYSKLAADKELGECEVAFWSSIQDIQRNSQGLKEQFVNKLANITLLGVVRLEPEIVRQYIQVLNKRGPKLIVAYSDAMYEVAKFAESNHLNVVPQRAIMVSAGTLYPYMRSKIEKVFQCKVFDRYGSREVGDVACERPGYDGLWVAPWGNYLEIVDDNGNCVTDGTKGEILVTSLTNFAMPLLRYQIGDRGTLSPTGKDNSQVLAEILGRSWDAFVNREGAIIESGYFMTLLYFRDWIARYQVIQKSPSCILFRFVRSGKLFSEAELADISAGAKQFMQDEDCEVRFEFVNEIPPSASGKFRFLISEVSR